MANNLLTINNQFEFNFPLTFVPDEIEKRYMGYLKAKRKMHASVLDFLNSTILNVSFPSITFNTVSNLQNFKRKKTNWKAVDNVYDLFDKTVTLTIQDVDAHINYFILLDVLMHKYLDINSPYDENMTITIVDENRHSLYQIVFREVIWTNLGDNSLAYNALVMGSESFSLQFTYNYIDIIWTLSNEDLITSSIDND